MLQRILGMQDDIRFMDASDAVGVALCHYYQDKASNLINQQATASKPIKLKKPSTKKSDWTTFINQNPDRIK
jgi:crossover junction endodeoxyribonuclease RuvC